MKKSIKFDTKKLAKLNNTQLPLKTPNVSLKELEDTLFNIKDLLASDGEFSLI